MSGEIIDGAGDEFDRLFLELLGRFVVAKFYVDDNARDRRVLAQLMERPASWVDYSHVCESPIEKRLFAHLLFITDGYEELSLPDYPFGESHVVTILEPQGSVGKYRSDFLITVRVLNAVKYIVIECDGHEFHEKTKQQAARDRARDRVMTAAGVMILRFTGSEIFHDARRCAAEVANLVEKVRSDLDTK